MGLYPTGQPGEIFIKMAKEGSTVSGLMDAFATSISLALQHGVPLKVLCEKFAHTRFEPSGWTGNEQIGYAKSLMDYIFRWLNLRFLSGTQLTLFAGLGLQVAAIAGIAQHSSGDRAGRRRHRVAASSGQAGGRSSQAAEPGEQPAGSRPGGGGIAPEAAVLGRRRRQAPRMPRN